MENKSLKIKFGKNSRKCPKCKSDIKEDIDKFATPEEKEFLKESWKGRLQKQYANFEEFAEFDAIYNLAKRLGYDSAEEAWEANPIISGSVNPEDYRRVRESKQLKESKNKKAKTRPVDNPYEIYKGYGPLADWEWRVLKHWQSPEKERENPYARVFCSVSSPMTYGGADMGDVYCRDIPGYKYETDEAPNFSKTVDSQRLKNLSNKEIDMIDNMFKK